MLSQQVIVREARVRFPRGVCFPRNSWLLKSDKHTAIKFKARWSPEGHHHLEKSDRPVVLGPDHLTQLHRHDPGYVSVEDVK
jgi:hypothetical protein